ncbi:MAG: hypothetical protein WC538_06835 [Thermoanaerobaculia bacterium]
MSDATPPTRKPAGMLRRLSLTLIAIALGWIVASNFFLNSPLASRTINRHPDRWKVTWDRAWMIVPGKVTASGIVYEQHIGRVDILVKARDASCTIPIRPLFERRFVLEGIHADSATAVLGRRPPQPPKPPAPPSPASTKPRKPGWFIEILNARIDSIEEFSGDNVSMTGGTSSVSGSFIKQLGGNMELRDVALSWKDANVRIKGSDEATKGLTIAFRGGMTPFSPRVDRGWASLKHLSGLLDVEGRIVSLAPLQAFFAGSGWMNGLNGAGDVSAHLLIDKGQLSPDSKLMATADDLAIAFMDFEASGAGHVGFARNASGKGDNTHIELVLDQFQFGRGADRSPLARGRNLQLKIDAMNFRLGAPADEVKVVVDLPESEMPDVAVLGEWLPEALGLKLSKGRARLSARLESTGPGRPAKGAFHVRGQQLTGKFRDLDFKVDMDAEMRLSGSQWNELKVGVDGTRVRFFNGDIRGEGVPVEPGWWMTLNVTNGKASFGKPLALEGDVDLTMRDIRAVIAVVAEVKEWLRKVDGILSVKDLEGQTRAQFSDKRIMIDGLKVSGDRLASEGDIHLGGAQGDGLLWVKFRRRDLAFEWEGQKRDWKFYNDRKWFDKRRAERASTR